MNKNVSIIQTNETSSRFPFRAFLCEHMPTYNHWHSEYEFVLVTNNRLSAYINGDTYPLRKGDIYFAAPGDVHGIIGADNSRIVLQFKPDIFASEFMDDSAISKMNEKMNALSRVSTVWKPETAAAVAKMIRQLDVYGNGEAERFDRQNIMALLWRIIMTCINEVPETGTQMNPNNHMLQNKKALKNLDRLFEYIGSNYMTEIRIEDAARVLNFSPNHFIKYWRKYVNVSFHTYVNEYRISKALALLTMTDYSVLEIAGAVGFTSITTFNRVFKKITGMNPREYKKKFIP